MAAAGDLQEAAHLAASNLGTLWIANTLKTKMIAFWQAFSSSFQDAVPNDRPIGDWIAVIAAFSPTILDFDQGGIVEAAVPDSITTYEQSVDYVYRLCKLAFYLNLPSVLLITDDQAQAILDAYNAQFA